MKRISSGIQNPLQIFSSVAIVHQGVVGLALMLGGALAKSDTVMRFGEALTRDDIGGASEWFRFEKEPECNMGYAQSF